jgi:hypothetical protein
MGIVRKALNFIAVVASEEKGEDLNKDIITNLVLGGEGTWTLLTYIHEVFRVSAMTCGGQAGRRFLCTSLCQSVIKMRMKNGDNVSWSVTTDQTQNH